ncbi:hypothetical protein BURMUCF2_A0779 [Burkholderia multivorans CF2]|nr:hypothetical protein BURMUCF2_A0779 [Burkholderia multivorans CF2]
MCGACRCHVTCSVTSPAIRRDVTCRRLHDRRSAPHFLSGTVIASSRETDCRRVLP